jgi:hypothetical protein
LEVGVASQESFETRSVRLRVPVSTFARVSKTILTVSFHASASGKEP